MSYGVTDRATGRREKGARVNVIQMLRSRSPGTKEERRGGSSGAASIERVSRRPTRTGAAERGKGVNVQVFVFGVPEKFNARP